MPDDYSLYIAVYLTVVNLWAVGLTLYDKRAAHKHARRVRERTLLLISLIGGSVAMLATMQIIRHKTKHKKFMVGIPIMIILQIAAVILLVMTTGN